MKKFLLALSAAMLFLSGCGGSSPAVQSGNMSSAVSGDAYIAFSADVHDPIVATIDGKEYKVSTIQTSGLTDKKIKEIADNIITLPPGTHEVTVTRNGKQVYRNRISVSAREHKVIKL